MIRAAFSLPVLRVWRASSLAMIFITFPALKSRVTVAVRKMNPWSYNFQITAPEVAFVVSSSPASRFILSRKIPGPGVGGGLLIVQNGIHLEHRRLAFERFVKRRREAQQQFLNNVQGRLGLAVEESIDISPVGLEGVNVPRGEGIVG